MTLKYKDYIATVFYDSDEEIYVGNVNMIKDCIIFHGVDLDEAQKNFERNINDYENKKNLQ